MAVLKTKIWNSLYVLFILKFLSDFGFSIRRVECKECGEVPFEQNTQIQD